MRSFIVKLLLLSYIPQTVLYSEDNQTLLQETKRYYSIAKKVDKGLKSLTKNTLDKKSIVVDPKKIKNTVSVPMLVMKREKKIMSFMNASILKNNSAFKSLKFLKNTTNKDVILLVFKGGKAIYSVLDGGITYDELSSLLLEGSEILGKKGFTKVIGMFIAPPAGMIIVSAGEYAIDKYIELDKRSYIGLEDMFWDVPNEIKNKITVLNIEESKHDTGLDFSELEKESIYDKNYDRETILENKEANQKSILEM